MYGRVLAAGALVAVLVPAGLAKPSSVITGDNDIGGFSLAEHGTLNEAIKEFGKPTSREKYGYDTCAVSWRQLGIRSVFSNNPDDPCGELEGARACHFESTITGRDWKTTRGLKIGHPSRVIRRLYPKAKPYIGPDWALLRRSFGGVRVPSLLATVRNGRVQAFVVKSFWLLYC